MSLTPASRSPCPASCSGLVPQFQGLRVVGARSALVPQARRCNASRGGIAITARQAEVGIGLFGTKAGMTQIFTPEGLALPATVIALEPGNIVTQVKTEATDGYTALQVGYRVCKEKKVTKPELNHLKKAGAPPMRTLREFKVQETLLQSILI